MNRTARLLSVCVALSLVPVLVAPAAAADGDEGGLFSKEVEAKRQPLPWEVPRPGEEECRPEELVVLRELRERSRAVDSREQAIGSREEAAKALELRLADEVTRLASLRAEMTSFLERASDTSAENVASLAKMVDAMKAREAAEMLGGMDEEVVLQVLRSIKAKQAGRVLGAMPPEKSQTLGDRYTLVPDPRDGLAEGSQE